MATIWYVSKYVVPPLTAKVGSRGFKLLREFVHFGHCAHLITSDSNHLANPPPLNVPFSAETVDGVHVTWVRTLKYSGARSFKRVLSWFHFEWQIFWMPKNVIDKPDVVIVSSLSLLSVFSGLLIKSKYNCKLVLEIRDIWPLTLTTTGRMSNFHPAVIFLAWVERIGYRHSDVIVGTMPNLVEHVRQVSQSYKPVFCIPQGVDPNELADSSELPPGYVGANIPSGKFIVCHAGSIGADNALGTLVSCARQMQDRTDVHFLIVGEGYLKASLMTEAQGLRNITFAPGVEKTAVQTILRHVDLLYFAVHKSRLMRFGQSLNKVVDYMLSGKPIVASFTGFESMINEAQCGSYVPAEDVGALCKEIERYAAMEIESRSEIGKRGREWLIENRTFEKLARQYLEIIFTEKQAVAMPL